MKIISYSYRLFAYLFHLRIQSYNTSIRISLLVCSSTKAYYIFLVSGAFNTITINIIKQIGSINSSSSIVVKF